MDFLVDNLTIKPVNTENSTPFKSKYNFDLAKIQHDVEEVIKYSQKFSCDVNAKEIIQDWLHAKEKFISNFKGNLICQLPELITFKLDEKSKKRRVQEFADYIFTHYNNEELTEFLYELNVEDFYNNKTSKNYLIDLTEEKNIPKNFKVVKAFKFFIKNKKLLKELQDKASQIIQENCIKGYLCLSVHPLDYLSASENTHNWRSCHALDGEYRAGNLNYMMDQSTIICYLRSEKEEKLPHFPKSVPWNSKKWRAWIHFSTLQDMIFLGRQYPFSCETGIKYIKNELLPLNGFDSWSKFYNATISELKDPESDTTFHFEKHIPVGSVLRPLKQLVKNGDITWHYNDILYSSCYKPLYSFRVKKINLTSPFDDTDKSMYINMINENTSFEIGHKCKCPICNEFYIGASDKICCDHCRQKYNLYSNDDYVECDCCGLSVPEEESYYLAHSNNYVCAYCYHTELAQCHICGARDFSGHFIYDPEKDIHLCSYCAAAEARKIIKNFKEE